MSSPDRLILISRLLIGQKASSNSKDCMYVLSILGLFFFLLDRWPKSINHTCFVGQDGEEKLLFGGQQFAYTVILPHVLLLFALVQCFFPACPRKAAGCCCAFRVSLANTFIPEQVAPVLPLERPSQNRYRIIES